MKILELINPSGSLVKRATIVVDHDRAHLAVTTVYGYHSDTFKTECAAKLMFGRDFMPGADWSEVKVLG